MPSYPVNSQLDDLNKNPSSFFDIPREGRSSNGPSQQKHSFNEREYLAQILKYIDQTYVQHYATGKYQATDTIIDAGWGTGFCLGNIIKYCKRYGKKDGHNKTDIMKIIHYAIIQLYIHDTTGKNLSSTDSPLNKE